MSEENYSVRVQRHTLINKESNIWNILSPLANNMIFPRLFLIKCLIDSGVFLVRRILSYLLGNYLNVSFNFGGDFMFWFANNMLITFSNTIFDTTLFYLTSIMITKNIYGLVNVFYLPDLIIEAWFKWWHNFYHQHANNHSFVFDANFFTHISIYKKNTLWVIMRYKSCK